MTEDHLHGGVLDSLCHSGQIRLIVLQRHFLIVYPIVPERTGALVHNADRTQKGVIGSSYGGDQGISRFQGAEQRAGDGVGAVDKLNPDQSGLRAEEPGVDLLQLFTAEIIIAVSGGTRKVALRYTEFLKSAQNTGGVLLRNFVNAGKGLRKTALGLFGQTPDKVADVEIQDSFTPLYPGIPGKSDVPGDPGQKTLPGSGPGEGNRVDRPEVPIRSRHAERTAQFDRSAVPFVRGIVSALHLKFNCLSTITKMRACGLLRAEMVRGIAQADIPRS